MRLPVAEGGNFERSGSAMALDESAGEDICGGRGFPPQRRINLAAGAVEDRSQTPLKYGSPAPGRASSVGLRIR